MVRDPQVAMETMGGGQLQRDKGLEIFGGSLTGGSSRMRGKPKAIAPVFPGDLPSKY